MYTGIAKVKNYLGLFLFNSYLLLR